MAAQSSGIGTCRSLLFVPAHKADWVAKALPSRPDAIILDLEDGVPAADKDRARAMLHSEVQQIAAQGVTALVRVNALDTRRTSDDIESAIVEGLSGIVVPKIETPADIVRVDA